MAKRLVVFNHKGGVSKTTSAYNIGWALAADRNVLLVDADPQCNLTGLLLGDGFEQYYLDAATSEQNIRDGVAHAFTGRPVPIAAVDCFRPGRSPRLHLLAGHANLSEYDAALTFAQSSGNALATLQNLPGAFGELLRLTEQKYAIDVTIIDLNPGLSAINQNLFLISDSFVIPTNPDPFSLMALDTLKSVLPRWVAWKSGSVGIFATSAYPMPAGTPKFLGTMIQRFNIRNGKAAAPYRDNIQELKDRTRTGLFPALLSAGMTLPAADYGASLVQNAYCLAEIPDFQGLLPKSQGAGVPVFAITDAEIGETGPVLVGMKEKRGVFLQQFTDLANTVGTLISRA